MRNNDRQMMMRVSGAALLTLAAACGEVGPSGLETGGGVGQATQPLRGGELVASNVAPYNSVIRLKAALPCSGVKIGTRRFLTAAHCMAGNRTGDTIQLTNSLEGTLGAPQNKTLSKVDTHPSYVYRRAPHDYFDVSVFEITTDTASIPSLPLRTEYVPEGTSLMVVAYGVNAAGKTGKKQKGQFTAVPTGDHDWDQHNVIDQNGVVYGAEGDSGSPWLVEGPTGTWKVGAIMSRANQASSWGARNGSINQWIGAPAINRFTSGEIGTFINGKSALCIDIANASLEIGAQAGQYYCDGRNQLTDNAFWHLGSTGAGRFNFVNRRSGLCLGVAGGSPDEGALIQQFTCVPSQFNNQSWSFVRTTGDFYQVRNAASGKCLSVNGGSFDPGVILVQRSCSALGTVNDQSWLLSR